MRDDKREIPWRRIESTDTPVVQSANNADEAPDMDTTTAENAAEDGHNADESTGESASRDWGASLAEKYLKNARHRKVSRVLPDGRRHVREWRDGEKIRDEKIAPRR